MSVFFLEAMPFVNTVMIIIGIIFIVCAFILSGAETAFFNLSQKEINILKTKTQPSFKRIAHLTQHPKHLLASIRIANILCTIILIFIINILFDEYLPKDENGDFTWAAWQVFAVKAITVLLVVGIFTQLVPKIWGANKKLQFASFASSFVQFVSNLFKGSSNRIVNYQNKIENKNPNYKNRSPVISVDQMDEAIDGMPDSEANEEEKNILKGVTNFSDTVAKQVMKPRLDILGIEDGDSFSTLLNKIREYNHSRYPVYQKSIDNIKGFLYTKDLLPYKNQSNFDWHTQLREAYFVPEKKLIEDLLQEFRSGTHHMAIVVDEFGGTSGLVTLEDLMEEIVGDIEDEFDENENNNTQVDDNTYIFEGKTMIKDACRIMKVPADTFDSVKGPADTVAGLVLELAGTFPEKGQSYTTGNFTFTVLDINNNRIEQVKVVKNAPAAGSSKKENKNNNA